MIQLRPARYWYTINSLELSKQIATSGGREIVAVLVTGGGGAAAVRLYDSPVGSGEPAPSKDAFLVAANGGESTAFCPAHPVLFKRGLYIELEQGGSSNGEATVFYN